MTEIQGKVPVAFITYAWNDDQDGGEHKARVKRLADELIADYGVEVLLDQYVLQPGVDADAYMEAIANSNRVDKVIAICEPNYVAKANERKGGVGKEGIIMSPKLYEQLQGGQSVEQRFVAVMFSGDQKPTMFGNSIHINMRDEQEWAENIVTLVRFIYNRPLAIPPKRGDRPAFLDEDPEHPLPSVRAELLQLRSSITSDRGIRPAMNRMTTRASKLLQEEGPTIYPGPYIFAQPVLDKINRLTPLMNELLVAGAQYLEYGEQDAELWAHLFEELYAVAEHVEHEGRDKSSGWHLRWFIHELFLGLIALGLENRAVEFTRKLASRTYEYRGVYQTIHGTCGLLQFQNSEEFDRLPLDLAGTQTSSFRNHVRARADQRKKGGSQSLMAADSILFGNTLLQQAAAEEYAVVWAQSLASPQGFAYSELPFWARFISKDFADTWAPVLFASNADELKGQLSAITAYCNQRFRWAGRWPRGSIAPEKIATMR